MNQEQKSSVKEENGSAPKSNAQPKSASTPSSKAGSSATTASGPVTEEEIRAVLMQKSPVTTQDLVAKFKARLRCSEVSSVKIFCFILCYVECFDFTAIYILILI